jgi:hypothetical protein
MARVFTDALVKCAPKISGKDDEKARDTTLTRRDPSVRHMERFNDNQRRQASVKKVRIQPDDCTNIPQSNDETPSQATLASPSQPKTQQSTTHLHDMQAPTS